MHYDNSAYWTEIHKDFADQLKAVGWPWLSEECNRLMYQSQSETVLGLLDSVEKHFQGKEQLALLDVGTGTGYWAALIQDWLEKQGYNLSIFALDISEETLQRIQERNPQIQVVQADLKRVDPLLLARKFDLVTAFYCLHHLVHLEEFLNGLKFTARSVNDNGILIIADPILTKPYSSFDAITDFANYTGNGVPRHLYILDDILINEGFTRLIIHPAISFLLSGTIEGNGRLQYNVCNYIFMKLHDHLYKSEKRTKMIAGLITRLDRSLKQRNWAYSASICIYKRQTI